MSIAAATCAPGVTPFPSPPRKRGPRSDRSSLVAPGSRFRGNDERCGSTVLRVVGGFAGDGDVVDMALAQPGAGDPDKARILLHLADRPVSGIAHRRPEAADQLMHDVANRPLVRHAALHTLWYQLQGARHLLLEVAVGRAARHRADRAHS